MSYIDAVLSNDKVWVVERLSNGKRKTMQYTANYVLYYPDENGQHKTIFGNRVSKFATRKRSEFDFKKKEYQKKYGTLYESDINPVFRCLSDNYLGIDPPTFHTCFFDIEVNWQPSRIDDSHPTKYRSKWLTENNEQIDTAEKVRSLSRLSPDIEVYDYRLGGWVNFKYSTLSYEGKNEGFAPTANPFNQVTSITVYLDWLEQLVTIASAPPHLSESEIEQIASNFENLVLFDREEDLFDAFFTLIEDADVLTGWNSEGYDIPYLVNRAKLILGEEAALRFCLLNQMPKPRKYERFGKEETTYDLVGRIHLDYLQLYKKYNYESRHSYKLDFIGEMEVGEHKVPYEGTLDQLYNRDFKKFIEYNQQDVMLLVKIHQKLRFLELANALAHENTVLLQTVMGSVAMIEMAIYNEAHSRGMVIPSKKKQESTGQAAGAYVAVPHKGIHEWIAICDLNSLYPSTIRALNMSPETIVGQLRQTLTNAYLEKKSIELGLAKSKSKKHVDIDSDESEDSDDYKFDSKTKRVTGPILWENMFGSVEYTEVMNRTDTKIWIDFENGESIELCAYEIYDLIFSEKSLWGLSANGTIFTFEFEGVIPGLLTRWYSERKDLQKKSKNAKDQKEYEYYDKRQLVRKILLNSALTHTNWRPYIARYIE